MAFNQPIEADRPDNLDHLTTFSRAPILGTIMWLLGGDMTLKLDEEESKESNVTQTNDNKDKGIEKENTTQIDTILSTSQSDNNIHVPDRILSDISEGSAMEDEDNVRLTKSFDECTIHDRNGSNRSLSNQSVGIKRMSWSDESGQSLVEYSNECSSREPPSAAIPIKSAMKRSNSTYSNPLHRSNSNSSSESIQQASPSPDGSESSNATVTQRYIPSLGGKIPRTGVKPGYISPQWGWYINTTPPPHEMYSSKSKKPDIDKKEENTNTSLKNNIVKREAYKPPTGMAPLPVFKHSITTPAHGWPNVPL